MKKTCCYLVMVMGIIGLLANISWSQMTIETPEEVPNIGSDSIEAEAMESFDGLSLYFLSERDAGFGEIFVATRENVSEPFGEPKKLGPNINGGNTAQGPHISADGLRLYFHDGFANNPDLPHIPGGFGDADIWMSSRATVNDEWGEPVNLGENINSETFDGEPSLTANELMLIFDSEQQNEENDNDIWMSTRDSIDDPWSPAVNLGEPINDDGDQRGPSISPDGLFLIWMDVHDRDNRRLNIKVSTRESLDQDFGEPFILAELRELGYLDGGSPSISSDKSRLYFLGLLESGLKFDDEGNNIGVDIDIWQAPILKNLPSYVHLWENFH